MDENGNQKIANNADNPQVEKASNNVRQNLEKHTDISSNGAYIRLRSSKAFCMRDLFVYISLAALVLILFIAFVFPVKDDDGKGFIVTRGNATILIYTFGSTPKATDLIEVEEVSNGYKIKIYHTSEKIGYNVILFNDQLKTADVIESNCSERKDCYYAPSISNSGAIYCQPHDLKITPLHGGDDDGVIAG
ncbi:MAG: hypothetical protein IKB30_00965 [Clostridia bacterium]|nr:hypothetical protein [Clostridia bacterium]